MVKTILSGVSQAVATTLTGKVTNFDSDGLLIDIKASGAGFVLTDFDNVLINATFRTAEGEDINTFSNVRLGDLLKLSDYSAGASAALQGGVGDFRAYIPLGNYMIEGDDSLELIVRLPGLPNAALDVEITAVDLIRMNENIKGYESIKGNGSEMFFKNVHNVYLCSAQTGAIIAVEDQERQYFISDRQVHAIGNATGRAEKDIDFGPIYNESSGLSQNVRVKVPADAYALVVRSYFPLKRLNRKAESSAVKLASIVNRIRVEDPEKATYLEAYGLI